ncbi:hypothetical protein ACHABQ_13555 [Nesterenkonia aurantiaca]|uniref:hypothetical protein n=1 Tax=Nesterenkonia aurantiaca TaxID=1436010 RepID=UPI003EE71DA5
MEQIIVQERVTVRMPAVALFGDIVHVPEEQMLLLNMPETADQYADSEVLTTVIKDTALVAQEASTARADLQRVVTIKDYSEHSGLAEELVRLGAIRKLAECSTGPLGSAIVIAEVLYPEASPETRVPSTV